MSDTSPGADDARVRKRRLSWVWLIPVASLAIGGWLLWTTLARRGPLIQITFQTAEGLQAGQSQVKFKDIQMGTVEGFDLTPDRSRVVMHVRMTSKAEALLTDGAQFWVVRPRVFAGDITGLNTVLSGSYMEMLPGEPGKPVHRDFDGLENPPALDPGNPGRQFHLTAPRLGALSAGSPLFFRDVEVGKVVGWTLAGMAESVDLNVFVRTPYDRWVHDDSHFWNTSGVMVKLGPEGVQLQLDSVKAAVLGGINFETPSGPGHEAVSGERHSFRLYSSEAMADAATAQHRVAFATYMSGSVDGLAAGAPVMLIGQRVGDVTSVTLQFNSDTDRARARVEFTIQLDRATIIGTKPEPPFPENWRNLVSNGLRVHLKGGNLLTGQKQLALQFDADAPAAALDQDGDVLILPTSDTGSGGLDDLSLSASQLLAKINTMPFEQIGRNLNGMVQGASAIVNGPQLQQALARLNATLAAAQDTVKHLDAGAAPALRRLPAIAAELQETLAQVKALAGSVSQGSAGDGKFGRDLDQALTQVSDTAQSVRMVADLLSRHPEALIRGRTTRVAN